MGWSSVRPGLVAILLAALAATWAAGRATAADAVRPALIYGPGGKFDKGFNQGATEGLRHFREASAVAVVEIEPDPEAKPDAAIERALALGANPILALGEPFQGTIATAAAAHPGRHFVLIDGLADGANVQSVTFADQEGAFLVGMIAALKSRSGKIGFVGGMDLPVIRRFQAGYQAGAVYARPGTVVLGRMAGTTPAAFSDPWQGELIARDLAGQGADVLFAAAGFTGLGAYFIAKEAGIYAIGVDANQNYLHPGVMLTSMVKRVDLAVYHVLDEAAAGVWKPGRRVLGLAENGVDFAVDEYNRSLLDMGLLSAVAQARLDIVEGRLKVPDSLAAQP